MLSRIENLLVYPSWAITSGDWSPAGYEYESINFASADGTRLHGWFFDHPRPVHAIVFYHGNGENVSKLGEFAASIRTKYNTVIFVFDYRGYGRSQGRPAETGVTADGHAAAAWLATRCGWPLHELIHWGRSLGGAVAVDVAVRQGARALILERTFATMPDAAAHLYPWLPVRSLMRNRYDSISKIARYTGALFQSHGTIDEVVPYSSGKRLFDACPSQNKWFLSLNDIGHNDPNPPEYFQAFKEFIGRLAARQPVARASD